METTVDKNKVIAEFMGLTYSSETKEYYLPIYNSGDWWNEDELSYHTSWDWIMPVVEKIESMEYWTEICNSPLGTKARPDRLMWFEIGKDNHRDLLRDDCYTRIARVEAGSKIEAVYNAVYEFITWWNKEKSGGNHTHN